MKKMKKRTKIRCIIAGAAVLVLGAGYTVFVAPKLQEDKWIYIESQVEKGNLTVGVSESGSLDYGITSVLYDLDLSVVTSDEEEDEEQEEETVQKYLKVEEVCVAAGERIKEGDALVRFTRDSVDGVRNLLESALIDAKASYNEAENEYRVAVLEAETEYESKLIAKKYAQGIYTNGDNAVDDEIATMEIQLAQYKNHTASLEEKVTEATGNYNEAYQTYVQAKESVDKSDVNGASNYMSMQTLYLNAMTKFQNAENSLKQAKTNLQNNTNNITDMEYKIADAKARRAIDKLDVEETYLENVINGDNAEIVYQATLESLKEDLQEEEENRKKIEEQLEAFEAFVGEEGILYADGEGIVTEVGYEAGDRLMNAGTVLSYAKPDEMTITVDVTQEDVVALAVGNPVEINFHAYEDEAYVGIIRSINTTATSRNSNTISYQVIVGVEGDTTPLFGGMTADITFVTEEKEDVLFVSRKAIVEQDDKTYVYVDTLLGRKELKQVETGIRNSTSVEIVSGLEEGDIVYIASKVSSEDEIAATGDGENVQDTQGGVSGFGDGGRSGFPNMDSMPDMSNMPDIGSFPGGGNFPGQGNFSGGKNESRPGREGRP